MTIPIPFLFVPTFRAFDTAGNPLAGGFLYTYAANTLTLQTTWSDALGATPNSNPVVLDSTGSATVRLSSAAYKFVLKDALGTTQWTQDFYQASYLGQSDIVTLLGVDPIQRQTAAETAAGVTPLNYAYEPGDLRRYATFVTGGGDVTTALANNASQAQQAGGAAIYIPGSMGALTVTAGVTFTSPVKMHGDGYQQSQISTSNDITILTFNLGASTSLLTDLQVTGKGTGATLPGILLTNCNQMRLERVRSANFGVNFRAAPGANSCYLLCCVDCRFESSQGIDFDAQKNTNQLRLYGCTVGGAPATTGLKLTDCTDCNAIGLNVEGVSLVGIDIDNPSGGSFAGSGHVFIDPHFETAASAGDIRIGNTALVNGVTVIGGYTNPTGSCDCGVNIGAGGCNGLRVLGHNVNAGYSGGVGYIRLTGTLTNETIQLGGLFQFSQYIAEEGKVNYADRGTLLLDGPTFLDANSVDRISWNEYKINSGSIVGNKNYYGRHIAVRVENTGAIAAGSQVYAVRAEASNAVGGTTKVGAIKAVGDVDISGGRLAPPKDDGTVQTGAVYQGSGVPSNSNGSNGDVYFRTDTPGTANQRIYVKSAGSWTGIL